MKFLGMILLTGLAFTACHEQSEFALNPQAKSHTNTAAKFQKTNDLEGSLQEVAQALAQQPEWLNARLAREMQRDPVSIARVLTQAPARLESEGRTYEVTLEAAKRSNFASDAPVRIALDPDRFYAEDPYVTVYHFDRTENRVVSERLDKGSASKEALAFPLVLVTLQDRTEISFQEMSAGSKIFQERAAALAKGSASESSNSFARYYLAITKVRLHTSHDAAGLSSFEEFELYVKEGNGPTKYVLPSTIHVFNGARRLDAAGRMVRYTDVNLIDTTYVFDQPIALWPLSNATPVAIVPLEDDCTSGQHKSMFFGGTYMKTYAEEYDRASNTKLYGTRQGYGLAGLMTCPFSSDDDTYDRGTFSNWTASNTPATEISVELGDLKIWVKRFEIGFPVPRVPSTEE